MLESPGKERTVYERATSQAGHTESILGLGVGVQPELMSQWLGIWWYHYSEAPCDQFINWKIREDTGHCLLQNTHNILRSVTGRNQPMET